MKNSILSLFLIAFATISSLGQKNNISVSENNGKTNISIQDSRQKLDIQVKGDVTFTEDEKGIQRLSRNGSISYKKNGDKLKITRESNGSLLYTINGTKKSVPDVQDEKIIAACVQTMINAGINGKERAQAIFKKNGLRGVFSELNRFESDYVKHIYLNSLVSNRLLADEEMISLLEKVNSDLKSDYYKAEVLLKMQKDYLKNAMVLNAYLAAVKKIDSDYYKTEVIKKSLSGSRVNDVQFEHFMDVVSQMKSDYYQAEIILAVLKKSEPNEKRYSQTLAAIQNMKSSYYQAEVLGKLIDKGVKDEAEWNQLIEYANKIESSYYRAEILRKIIATRPK